MRPMPELEVVKVATSDLLEYENNAKLHPLTQIDQIAASIEEFGFNSPILAWHNDDGEPEIVAGHGRLMAARKLGLKELPVVFLDHMSEEQRRAYILVDNQLTMNSGFDFEILQGELSAITNINMDDFGFDMSSLDFGVNLEDDNTKNDIVEDSVPESAPSRVKHGDVWQLGRHRLMCGDSTDADSVARLMNGKRADVCFTSPPYNLGRVKLGSSVPRRAMGAGNPYGEYDDDLTDGQYERLLTESLRNALDNCDDAMFNIGILSGSKLGIIGMLNSFKNRFCDIIVWSKSKAMPMGLESQRGLVAHECELVFCFNGSGTRSFTHPQWDKGHGTNRIETENNTANEHTQNHAAFPVVFASEVVRNFTQGSVLDLFGGTGTTLIAAEQLGRTCYMMELDPSYCDVIIARWEELTGEKAVKEEGN